MRCVRPTWPYQCRSFQTVDEFDLIERLLAPLAAGAPGAMDLGNDGATIQMAPGQELVVTKDMMAAGVHFLADDPPDLIARKLLRVNLSDMAAMGAVPLGYLVGAGLNHQADEAWLTAFVEGLRADQQSFGVDLLGGDTIGLGEGPMVLSLTALGQVPVGRALTRSGARPGDMLAVSGTIGDAALGLLCLKGDIVAGASNHDYLVERYRLPRPRVELGMNLVDRASAALDVSDGLVADAMHLARRSGVAIEIDAGRLPLSPAARRLVDDQPERFDRILSGGDDYELLFTISEDTLEGLQDSGVSTTVIGVCREGQGVRVHDASGADVTPANPGWRHTNQAI